MDGEQHNDAAITQMVQSALAWAVSVSDGQVSCAVTNGQVTLNGRVLFWAQRAHIERAVRVLADVSCVFNRIRVYAAQASNEPVIEVIRLPSNVLCLEDSVTRGPANDCPGKLNSTGSAEPAGGASTSLGQSRRSR